MATELGTSFCVVQNVCATCAGRVPSEEARKPIASDLFYRLSSSLIRYSAQGLRVLIEGVREHLFYGFNWDEAELLSGFFGDIDEILFIQLRNDHRRNIGPHRGKTLFFQSADWQNHSAQGDLTCHSDIGAYRLVAEQGRQRGKHRHPGRGS